jgi:predicted nucleic acid-binding protein
MTKHPDCLIDTNVVLRHVLNDDPKQAAAVKSVFDALRSGEKAALFLESVLAECVYILLQYYEVPKSEVVEKLDGVLRYPGIVNRDKHDLREALKLFGEHALDFVDCVLVAKARIGELELVTFDEKLKKMRENYLMSAAPGNVP